MRLGWIAVGMLIGKILVDIAHAAKDIRRQ